MTFKKLTPLAVVLSVLIATFIPVTTIKAAEGGELYQGTAKIISNSYLLFRINRDFDYDSDVAYFDSAYYEGKGDVRFQFYQNEGHVYNGRIRYELTYTMATSTANMSFSWPQITLETTSLPEGIHINAYTTNRSVSSFTVLYEFDFNNYVAGYSGNMYIPVVVSAQQIGNNIVDNSGYYSSLGYSVSVPSDWTGTLYDYADMTDAPSYEAKTINAIYATNQYLTQFKDAVATHFTELKSNMQTWYDGMTATLNTQFSDVKAWLQQLNITITDRFTELFNKLDEDQNESINGYNNTGAENANNSLSNSITDIDDSQQTVISNGTQSLDDYTIPTDGIVSYGTKFVGAFAFVGSCMQAIYDNSGGFTIALSVACTVLIISMLIGLTKFYKE